MEFEEAGLVLMAAKESSHRAPHFFLFKMTDRCLRWPYIVKISNLCSQLIGGVGIDSGKSVR